jgi:hypothetical protein
MRNSRGLSWSLNGSGLAKKIDEYDGESRARNQCREVPRGSVESFQRSNDPVMAVDRGREWSFSPGIEAYFCQRQDPAIVPAIQLRPNVAESTSHPHAALRPK